MFDIRCNALRNAGCEILYTDFYNVKKNCGQVTGAKAGWETLGARLCFVKYRRADAKDAKKKKNVHGGHTSRDRFN